LFILNINNLPWIKTLFLSKTSYQVILSGLAHVLVIAILEILLYFWYITDIEKEELGKLQLDITEDLSSKCEEQFDDPILISEPDYNNILLTIEDLEEADESGEQIAKDNRKLAWLGFYIIIGIMIIMLLFFVMFKPYNQKWIDEIMWKEISRDVFVTVFFVAIFEIILINFIVTKYKLVSPESLELEIMSKFLETDNCFKVVDQGGIIEEIKNKYG